jgi:hypothetical protein
MRAFHAEGDGPERRLALGFDSLAIVVAGGALLLGACATTPMFRDPVPLPDVHPGESWTYQVTDVDYRQSPPKGRDYMFVREVERVSDKEIWVRDRPTGFAGATQMLKFDRGWNLIEGAVQDGSFVRFIPHKPALLFPLGSKAEWGENFGIIAREGELPAEGRAEGKVHGWEEVHLLAGTMQTVRVDLLTPEYAGPRTLRIFADPSRFGGSAESYWYAPQLKTIARYQAKHYVQQRQTRLITLELVDYKIDSQSFAR